MSSSAAMLELASARAISRRATRTVWGAMDRAPSCALRARGC
jgi:hypothetical protein